jgi:hypothetical protein
VNFQVLLIRQQQSVGMFVNLIYSHFVRQAFSLFFVVYTYFKQFVTSVVVACPKFLHSSAWAVCRFSVEEQVFVAEEEGKRHCYSPSILEYDNFIFIIL